MELTYKTLQISIIVFHVFVMYKRYASHLVSKSFRGMLGTGIQVFLCFFMIKELTQPFWEFKAWFWFIFDYALAIHFFLTYLQHYRDEQRKSR